MNDLVCSICLDTSILLKLSSSSNNEAQLRKEYGSISRTNTIPTKWSLTVFTENEFLSSPLAIWEYAGIKLRELVKNGPIDEIDLDRINSMATQMDEKSTRSRRFAI